MIESASMIMAAVTAALGCAGGFLAASVAGKRELERRDEAALRMLEESRVAKRRWETTDQERVANLKLLRRACLQGEAVEASPAASPAMVTAREYQAMVSLVRGFAFIDDVVIADAAGFSRVRDETPSSRTLCALAPALSTLEKAFADEGVELASIEIATSTALHLTARVLPPRMGGSFLFASSRSRAPNVLALDSVVARALLAEPAPSARPPRRLAPVRGTTGIEGGAGARAHSLGQELVALQARAGTRAAAFAFDGQALVAVLDDGPSASHCQAWCTRLEQLRKGIRRAMKVDDIVMIDLATTDGLHISYSPIADHAGCAVLTVGARALEGIDVERFLGRVRRLLSNEGGFEPRRLAASSEAA